MALFLYNLFVLFYSSGIRLASIWNNKAKLWVQGRSKFPAKPLRSACVWVHCASLGEFEQGRPVIEAIKNKYPEYKILLTFFSPSGYEIRKNYEGADLVLYLPTDTAQHAREFIKHYKPALVIWIKYEFWYHYLTELKRNNIPVLLVSGIFREDQPFFKTYGKLWKKMLQSFQHLFVQNEKSLQLLHSINITNASIIGDTRFDRVLTIANNFSPLPVIQTFCGDKKVIVAGSTWEEDEDLLVHYANSHPEIKIIIAPHEIGQSHLDDIYRKFKNAISYSQLIKNEETTERHVLVIDNIGLLSALYGYATITYVGGGFNSSGIHNILEAAVYGKPVIFGPCYEKFKEAKELLEKGGAFSIDNAIALETLLNDLFADETLLQKSSNIAAKYVQENSGATESIMHYIAEKRLLTN